MEGLDTGRFTFFFTITLFRYLIIAAIGFFVFYRIKRNDWSYRKIQIRFPALPDYAREILYSVLTAFIFTCIGYILFLTPVRQYTQLYTQLQEYGLTYFVLSILLILLIHDTYFYWTHRFMHQPFLFRYFHRVHHLSTNPSPWAAFAFHPYEAVIEAGIIVLVAFIMPIHPLAIVLFLLIMMVYNVYGHLGYELYPKGFTTTKLGKWVNTSVNHNQHHQHVRGNYGLYFLWWDRWMGTLRSDYDKTFETIKSRAKNGD
jgi:sterol desaturase/sphingolipid hydroxylase (fatty acid hydroxylase superfamily)